ncbi:hypothetical protein L1765_15155 [Microaerobacter geothermalis]|uniref:hypothetical protein n=1 Tax=Microaerobacter geothermalis TaxID=674972 RepID=UPI001F220128|nr:hypothetical protein [Microaerobacter geothermalis]MCF6095294.1 hypothetical protein [Microaerobacter geothermalis]
MLEDRGDYVVINDLIEVLRNELPEKAIEIGEVLELLLDSLIITRIDIGIKLQKANDSKNFTLLEQLATVSRELAVYESKIQDFRNLFEVDFIQEKTVPDAEKSLPDYEQYRVDNNIEHTLYENFSHKRPFAFEFEGRKVMVDTWIDMLIKTAEILFKKDRAKIESFANDEDMNGRKMRYFSLHDKSGMRKPVQLAGEELYIETNLSANSIRNIIVKMLQKYGIKITEFKIYLRADYTELHK